MLKDFGRAGDRAGAVLRPWGRPVRLLAVPEDHCFTLPGEGVKNRSDRWASGLLIYSIARQNVILKE